MYRRTFAALASLGLLAVPVTAWADDPLEKHTIYAYGINATFIGYGARITNLWVHDRNNQPRDIIVGYDDPARYIQDTATNHTYFGGIVG